MRFRRSSPILALIASATADRLVNTSVPAAPSATTTSSRKKKSQQLYKMEILGTGQGYCQWRRPDGGDAYTGLMDEVSITIG